jgi:hypothetical protein
MNIKAEIKEMPDHIELKLIPRSEAKIKRLIEIIKSKPLKVIV